MSLINFGVMINFDAIRKVLYLLTYWLEINISER